MRIKYLFGILACVCVLAVCATIVTVVLVGRDGTAPDGDTTTTEPTGSFLPTLEMVSVAERGEWVEVETTFGSFRYPAAFADFFGVEAVDQGESARLQFDAQLAGKNVTVYTIHYNKAVGLRCGTLKLSDTAAEIAVYAEFAEKTDDIPADWLKTFYAVQETFNDVLLSMAEDGRFTMREGV